MARSWNYQVELLGTLNNEEIRKEAAAIVEDHTEWNDTDRKDLAAVIETANVEEYSNLDTLNRERLIEAIELVCEDIKGTAEMAAMRIRTHSEWLPGECEILCELAGIEDELREWPEFSLGYKFAVMKAAKILGVNIYR